MRGGHPMRTWRARARVSYRELTDGNALAYGWGDATVGVGTRRDLAVGGRFEAGDSRALLRTGENTAEMLFTAPVAPAGRALTRYTEDGRLKIDNNGAEQALRPIVLGRKNWLFAGSFEGARRAALLYSLIQSCRLIDLPPFPYLRDVLVRIATHPHQRLHELTPRGWKATFGTGSLA